MTWQTGQEVIVLEHDDATRQPRPGGRAYQAVVTKVGGPYVRAEFSDPDWPGKAVAMAFWADSGWAAWDGVFRWRLVRQDGET